MAKSNTTTTPRTRAKKAAPEVVQKVLEGGKEPISEEQREAEQGEELRANEAGRRKHDALSLMVAQMTAPAAVSEPKADLDAFNAEVAALAAKHHVDPKTLPLVSNHKAQKIVKNGVTRPGIETKCGMIWSAADEITVQTKAPATLAELRMRPELSAINDHTMKTQYARWRGFNGITGRITKVTQAQVSGVVMQHDGHP